jgi:hypothetical protein
MRTAIYLLSLASSLAFATTLVRADDPMPLSGPAVREGSVPGDAKAFSGGPGRRREGDRPLAHRTFLQALRILQEAPADSQLHLSTEQATRLRELEKGYEKELRTYFEKHRDEIIKAKDTLGLKTEVGAGDDFRRGIEGLRKEFEETQKAALAIKKKKDAEEPMSEDGQREAEQAAREKLKQLYTNAPKAGDVHTKQWALLSEVQQKAVTDELARMREQEETDRREYLTKRDTLKQELEDVIAGKKELDINDPRLPEKIRERLAPMNAEQRRQAIAKFLAERSKRSAGGAEKKDAPSMDEVQLPTMEAPAEPGAK